MNQLSNTRLGMILSRLPARRAVALLLALFALVSFAQAGVIFDSGGFEGYSLGPLWGQNGWEFTGTTASTSTATVENSMVFAGTAAVAVSRGANDDQYWAVPVTVTPTAQQQIVINWQERVPTLTGSTSGFGPFFGVTAYDGNVTVPTTHGPGEFGSFGIDATTDTFLYQQAGTGNIEDTLVSAGTGWNQMQMVLDFGTQQYKIYANGTLLKTQGFVDGAYNLTTFTDGDLSALAAGGDSVSLAMTGTAYIDNFSEQVVPEPGTLGLLMAGVALCLGGAWWRKR